MKHPLGRPHLRGVSHLALVALVGLGLLPGCTPPLPIPAITPVPSPTTTATLTVTPTATALPTPTATATPRPLPTPTPTPSATRVPLHLEVKLDSAQVLQGHTALVRVIANRPCQLSGSTIEDRQLNFVSTGQGEYVTLIGVHALAKPGPQVISIAARTVDGQRLSLSTSLFVLPGDFQEETIVLTPQLEGLLDPELTQPELLRLAEVYAAFTRQVGWSGPFDWPIEGPVTSDFGTRRQYGNVTQSFHTGIDIDGETGDTILAPADGVVVLAELLQVRGGAVIIDHGAGVLSGYYHLDEIGVRAGQTLKRGDLLGRMGSTGFSTGSHLHWELRVGGVAVSPSEWTLRAFP